MPIIRFGLLFFTILGLCAARAEDSQVPALVWQEGTDHLYPIVAQGHGRVKWTHGAFLFADAPSPDFYTINREGDVISRARLEIPDDAHYFLTDFDRWSDGSIVAAMVPDRDDASPFLAFITADGKTKKRIKTAHYHPSLLTVAKDGTVWTLGLESIHGGFAARCLSAA